VYGGEEKRVQGLGEAQEAGCCELGNEPLGSIKCGQFCD
jgi:hypothetical protein